MTTQTARKGLFLGISSGAALKVGYDLANGEGKKRDTSYCSRWRSQILEYWYLWQ